MNAAIKDWTSANRTPREIGEITKAKIIETGGRLFAERGYVETTNKEIAKVAGVNVTSINYYFFSREGLYEAVIAKVHDYLLSSELFALLDDKTITDREKLERFIDSKPQLDGDNWPLRLWARELVAPSSIWLKMANKNIMPKFGTVAKIISGYTGIPIEEPELSLCLLYVISPVVPMTMINWKQQIPSVPQLNLDRYSFAKLEKMFIFSGIDGVIANYAFRKGLDN